MAKKKNTGRDLHGLVVLDKPLGVSSNQALQRVKRLFDAKKAGHTGTLDPLATGVLVICLGRATKIAQHITDANKTYFVVAKLGEITSTSDQEGELIEKNTVTSQHIKQIPPVLNQFVGEIDQIPPMYSALKQNGTPLYKLAREGVDVPRASRKVIIHSIAARKIESPFIELTVECSKGTYIRTLIEDIGRALGCGAHVSQLRRTQVGEFGKRLPMITLADIETQAALGLPYLDRMILSIEKAFLHYPHIELKNGLIQLVEQGSVLKLNCHEMQEYLRIYDTNNRFRGLGQLDKAGSLTFHRFYSQ